VASTSGIEFEQENCKVYPYPPRSVGLGIVIASFLKEPQLSLWLTPILPTKADASRSGHRVKGHGEDAKWKGNTGKSDAQLWKGRLKQGAAAPQLWWRSWSLDADLEV
jgi:hypothetical protein